MNLKYTLVFALLVATFIIGVHQTIVLGFEYSYWIFMLSVILLLLLRLIKKPEKSD